MHEPDDATRTSRPFPGFGEALRFWIRLWPLRPCQRTSPSRFVGRIARFPPVPAGADDQEPEPVGGERRFRKRPGHALPAGRLEHRRDSFRANPGARTRLNILFYSTCLVLLKQTQNEPPLSNP
jgi:hypothetical protein